MVQRLGIGFALVLMLVACGKGEQVTREGYKATAAAKGEATEDGQKIRAKLDEAAKTAQGSLVKEEVAKPPLVTEYYLLTEAYSATGFRPEALKKKLTEDQIKGKEYVKLVKYNDMPENADIYDDMGNHLYIISYLWDSDFNVYGCVEKSSNDRMLAMHLFCKGESDMYVHDLSTFRVHAPFVRKIITLENSLTVELRDGHNAKGELDAWPECKDVTEWQEKAGTYQSPFGVSKEVYNFDADGNLVMSARYDLKGALVEDINGVAKREVAWENGLITQESFYSADELLARYVMEHDDKGNVTRKSAQTQDGQKAADYFGISVYEYERDKRGRTTREVRKDVADRIVEVHEYTYAKYNQVETHKVLDGQGTVLTSFVSGYNKKGARTDLSVYEGEAKDGKLKADFNGVALYRFDYTDKGKLLQESRHGTTQVVDKDGKQDYQLVNALDGWALLANAYDKDGKHESSTAVKVDGLGNRVFEEFSDMDGVLVHRIERKFDGPTLTGSVKTTLTREGVPEKRFLLDPQDKVLMVGVMQHNSDGLLLEIAFYLEDGTTPQLSPDGFHKLVKAYDEDGKIKSETCFDVTGLKLKTTMYEYAEDGTLKGTKTYDAEGKEITVPAA
ncbi:MAG: hypothetical protein FJ109_00845 [Deltaproteobacteria bacterium]|nr:hypothetical protein [Deltaproteobacteria bacterium]